MQKLCGSGDSRAAASDMIKICKEQETFTGAVHLATGLQYTVCFKSHCPRWGHSSKSLKKAKDGWLFSMHLLHHMLPEPPSTVSEAVSISFCTSCYDWCCSCLLSVDGVRCSCDDVPRGMRCRMKQPDSNSSAIVIGLRFELARIGMRPEQR